MCVARALCSRCSGNNIRTESSGCLCGACAVEGTRMRVAEARRTAGPCSSPRGHDPESKPWILNSCGEGE